MTGDGPVMVPDPKYRELQQESVRSFEWVAGIGTGNSVKTPTWGETFGYCARVLGVNFRIGLWELSALGFLNTNNARDIVFYSLGMKQFLEQAEALKNG
jgi:hypothetical protein